METATGVSWNCPRRALDMENTSQTWKKVAGMF